MPNNLDFTGLTIKTLPEITDELKERFRDIYGQEINVEQNTPDGQIINIFAQSLIDNLELLQEIFNSFNPDTAAGRLLDLRCAINGVQRRAGTYTRVNIAVQANRALNLAGLDTDSPYTIADAQGNEFCLESSYSFETYGTQTLAFRAKNMGAVEVLPNTITEPVTVILGIVSLNNPQGAITTGTDEETDAQLRVRRQQSLSLSGSGFLDNLRSALNGIDNVINAAVYQNRGSQPDQDDIPAHGVWVIVDGGLDADIGAVMNAKMTGGLPMKGALFVSVEQIDGSYDTFNFDRALAQPLYINLTLKALNGQAIPQDYIKAELVKKLSYQINETANAGAIGCAVLDILPNISVNALVSAGDGDFALTATPDSKQHKFTLSADNISITIA
jgi:uncharacterized phage protein gp47/JayE